MRFSIVFTAIFCLAVSARADTFTLTVNDKVNTFTLPATPLITHAYDFGFAISSVPVVEDGVNVVRNINFFNAATGGGLLIESSNGPDFNGQGEALYAGPNTQPTFLPGTFQLVGADSGVLTISTSAAAPEPSSVLLFAFGILGILGVLIRKNAKRFSSDIHLT